MKIIKFRNHHFILISQQPRRVTWAPSQGADDQKPSANAILAVIIILSRHNPLIVGTAPQVGPVQA
jgi:hypothetical protein